MLPPRRSTREILKPPTQLIAKEIARLEAVIEKGIRLLEDVVRARLAAQSEMTELSAELRRIEAEAALLGDATPARLSPAEIRRRVQRLDRHLQQCRERERHLSTAISQGEAALWSVKREADDIQQLWRQARDLTRMRLVARGMAVEPHREPWGGVPARALADMGDGEASLYATTTARLRDWRRRAAATTSTLKSQLRGRR
ncbi:MAG: hypothetical protein HRF45_10855 [Fimbriimonadia bacterium]|jgi:exonuclease VII large subunit